MECDCDDKMLCRCEELKSIFTNPPFRVGSKDEQIADLQEHVVKQANLIKKIDLIVNNPLTGQSYEDEVRKVLAKAKENKNG